MSRLEQDRSGERSTKAGGACLATFISSEPLSMRRLHGMLRDMPKTIFRAKGIINLSEKPGYPVILQSTGSRATLTVGNAWGEREPVTQIVFIGSQGGVDSQWLEEQLAR